MCYAEGHPPQKPIGLSSNMHPAYLVCPAVRAECNALSTRILYAPSELATEAHVTVGDAMADTRPVNSRSVERYFSAFRCARFPYTPCRYSEE
jgi:hypothetical protein